jgi:hypothetical protein
MGLSKELDFCLKNKELDFQGELNEQSFNCIYKALSSRTNLKQLDVEGVLGSMRLNLV